MEMSQGQMIGLLLISIGIMEAIMLVLFGVLKQKPMLIPAGAISGLVTAALGVVFYMGKIAV